MILGGNSDLLKGIPGTENVNIQINTRLLKSCLFLIKVLTKHMAAKSKVITFSMEFITNVDVIKYM